MTSLSTFLVGGAVRDQLLGIPNQDNDWVVVGSTPDQMLRLGYQPIGADFPVFLHPKTKEEYALARTERKSGHGYHGFQCNSDPSVTLEDDLLRRDLTINAMARTENGEIIDPYNGQMDLQTKQLRHVSEAFKEDPLRVLRVARFAARFAPLGFKIAPDTRDLMKRMSQDGELAHLNGERIWRETRRALSEHQPHVYFEVLRDVGALKATFPELDALFGVPQPEKYHPEIDCGVHALLSLERACELSDDIDVRFASLIHDLGKALTPDNILPSHHGHEKQGLKPIKALCRRIKTPKSTLDLAMLVSEFHTHIHRALELRSDTVLKVLKRCDVFRRPDRFKSILLCATADARGRTGHELEPYPQAQYFQNCADMARRVDIQALCADGSDGKVLGKKVDQARARAIETLKE